MNESMKSVIKAETFMSQQLNEYIDKKNEIIKRSYISRRINKDYILSKYVTQPISIKPKFLRTGYEFLANFPVIEEDGSHFEISHRQSPI
jgi:hypothetical protein